MTGSKLAGVVPVAAAAAYLSTDGGVGTGLISAFDDFGDGMEAADGLMGLAVDFVSSTGDATSDTAGLVFSPRIRVKSLVYRG
jgi:hypothetical protein